MSGAIPFENRIDRAMGVGLAQSGTFQCHGSAEVTMTGHKPDPREFSGCRIREILDLVAGPVAEYALNRTGEPRPNGDPIPEEGHDPGAGSDHSCRPATSR